MRFLPARMLLIVSLIFSMLSGYAPAIQPATLAASYLPAFQTQAQDSVAIIQPEVQALYAAYKADGVLLPRSYVTSVSELVYGLKIRNSWSTVKLLYDLRLGLADTTVVTALYNAKDSATYKLTGSAPYTAATATTPGSITFASGTDTSFISAGNITPSASFTFIANAKTTTVGASRTMLRLGGATDGATDIQEFRQNTANLSQALVVTGTNPTYVQSTTAINLTDWFTTCLTFDASNPTTADLSTTVTTGTASAIQTVGSTTGLAVGSTVYFPSQRLTRTVLTVDSATQITLTSTITTTTGEAVAAVTRGRAHFQDMLDNTQGATTPATAPSAGLVRLGARTAAAVRWAGPESFVLYADSVLSSLTVNGLSSPMQFVHDWLKTYHKSQTRTVYVDTRSVANGGTGLATGNGLFPSGPRLSLSTAIGRLNSTSIPAGDVTYGRGGTVRMYTPTTYYDRVETSVNYTRAGAHITVEPWTEKGVATAEMRGSDLVSGAAAWTSEGSGVYSAAVASDPANVWLGDEVDGDGDFTTFLKERATPTVLDAGEFGYSGGRVYIRLVGNVNPNTGSRLVEVSQRDTCILIKNGLGNKITLKGIIVRGAGRYGVQFGDSTRGAKARVLDGLSECNGGKGVTADGGGGYGSPPDGGGGLYSEVELVDTTSNNCWNDNFNWHCLDGQFLYVRMFNCGGRKAKDEIVSSHDDVRTLLIGGIYTKSVNGACMAMVNDSYTVVYGATFSSGNTGLNAPTLYGGIYFDSTATGTIDNITVSGNFGPGIYLQTIANVTLSRITSATNAQPNRPVSVPVAEVFGPGFWL